MCASPGGGGVGLGSDASGNHDHMTDLVCVC